MVSIKINEKKGKKLDRPFLREWRRSKGLRQKEVAEKLGISLQHYKNIESGFSDPSYKNLERFAKIFGNPPLGLWTMFQKVDKKEVGKHIEIIEIKDTHEEAKVEVIRDGGKK